MLFALSGNQCAHPDCALPVTDRRTVLVAEVCHIHPRRPGNPVHPRWNPDLSEDELNDISNLILLCRHHHRIVDRTEAGLYSADQLKQWKDDHERKRLPPQHESYGHFPASLVDQAILADLQEIRNGRFLGDFQATQRCLQLGTALTKGDYLAGTPATRCRALAWCARLLAPESSLPKAKELLQSAQELDRGDEVTIAAAVIRSREEDYQHALASLARVESPMARSAALGIVARETSAQEAIQWASDAGLEVADFDEDGKTLLLAYSLESGDWKRAGTIATAVVCGGGDNPPSLDYLAALAHLLHTVPEEFRQAVRDQEIVVATGLPLASDNRALRYRRLARQHFRAAFITAQGLGCTASASLYEEYALWLELLDPECRLAARVELEMRIQKPAENIRIVPLAVKGEVEINLDEIDQAIRSEAARHGGATPATAAARLALATARGAPGAVADYIDLHRADFAGHVDQLILGTLEADALAQAGRVERARSRLNQLLEDGLPSAEADRLHESIAKAEGEDTTASAKRRFEETGSLTDLLDVVGALSAAGSNLEVCHYAELLFRRTQSLEHAETLARALAEAREDDRLAEFLDTHEALVAQSEVLKLCLCWSLFQRGSLAEAKDRLQSLVGSRDQNYRNLQVQLAIALGDWDSLSTFIESEYQARETRDRSELARAASLAIGLELPRAKALAFAAAAKADDDAGALAGLYVLAVQAGWDDDPVVGAWFSQAVALSGTDGPFQRISLPTLMTERPKWYRQRASLLEQVDRGEIPAFLAAETLNTSLSSLVLLPALANRSETDPRRRQAVPAYSGRRPQQVRYSPGGRTAFDPAALLTLALLDLLDEALDAFEVVYVPHSTLAWLFAEKQNASFHQPSRVREARWIRQLLARGRISRLDPTVKADRELAAQVGDELAALIAEAEATHSRNERRYVVRPFPVHHIASLMDQAVDLTGHCEVLSSCGALVDSLHQDGILLDEQHRAASWYLSRNEQPWPNQPRISRPATLYLDRLATTYFLHLNLLELLSESGFEVFVTSSTESEALELLAYEDLSVKVHELLERIRTALHTRIVAGQVRVGPSQAPERSDDRLTIHPSMELFNLGERCDTIISDDRFLNKYPHVSAGEQAVPIVSTVNLLDMLESAGGVTKEDRLKYRSLLRRFGFIFVPVEQEELSQHLLESRVEHGRIVETSGLRALRENLLLARMGCYLQLPEEEQWLADTMNAFVGTLKSFWLGDPDVSQVITRSDWVLAQMDFRGWTHRLPKGETDRTVEGARAEQVLGLLFPPADASLTVQEKYWEWVEDRLLGPIQTGEPTLYSWLTERLFLTVSRVAAEAAEELESGDE